MMKSKDKLITTLEKNSMEEYRFSLQEYRECRLVDIRVYFTTNEGESLPTRKGISVPLDKFQGFMECLRKVEKAIKRMKVPPPDDIRSVTDAKLIAMINRAIR